MTDDVFIMEVKIPHTEPKTPVIVALLLGTHTMKKGGEIPESIHRVRLLNSAIFMKAEIAKSSYRTIEKHYSKYVNVLEDGRFAIRPLDFLPAMKEIDLLIFELGSILDFFAREINFAYKLGIKIKYISFGRLIHELRNHRTDLPITKHILDFADSDTHSYFRKMRNMVTHRLPFRFKGSDTRLFFPDDPDSDEVYPTTDLMIDVCKTCKKWLYEILFFVDQTSIEIFLNMAELKVIGDETGTEFDFREHFKRDSPYS